MQPCSLLAPSREQKHMTIIWPLDVHRLLLGRRLHRVGRGITATTTNYYATATTLRAYI